MFTGIVEELGTVVSAESGRLTVACSTVTEDAGIGASIAVNGVCLTVVERGERSLSFELSDETIRRTDLGSLRRGDAVNLERPVTLTTRLGGHLVQGHVDAVGILAEVSSNGGGRTVRVRFPEELRPYLVEKGSVAVDGVSLTVAGLDDNTFAVALVPRTLEATTLGRSAAGDRVNLEVDLIAKYVERMVAARG